MSGRRGFQYPLAPVLLTRGWALNDLLQELGEVNAALVRQREEKQALLERTGEAAAAWSASTGAAQALSVHQFALVTGFLADLARQTGAVDAALAHAEQARDRLIAEVVAAQRALEAFEQHRDELQARFNNTRMSGDFKIADDQWNTLQARIGHHET